MAELSTPKLVEIVRGKSSVLTLRSKSQRSRSSPAWGCMLI